MNAPDSEEAREAVARAKRFFAAFDESAVIDDIATKLVGEPDKPARIEAAAEEFESELKKIGGSELFTRYCKATFTLVLAEKIAELGGDTCQCR